MTCLIPSDKAIGSATSERAEGSGAGLVAVPCADVQRSVRQAATRLYLKDGEQRAWEVRYITAPDQRLAPALLPNHG